MSLFLITDNNRDKRRAPTITQSSLSKGIVLRTRRRKRKREKATKSHLGEAQREGEEEERARADRRCRKGLKASTREQHTEGAYTVGRTGAGEREGVAHRGRSAREDIDIFGRGARITARGCADGGW